MNIFSPNFRVHICWSETLYAYIIYTSVITLTIFQNEKPHDSIK